MVRLSSCIPSESPVAVVVRRLPRIFHPLRCAQSLGIDAASRETKVGGCRWILAGGLVGWSLTKAHSTLYGSEQAECPQTLETLALFPGGSCPDLDPS